MAEMDSVAVYAGLVESAPADLAGDLRAAFEAKS
jgi:hypothetical protein